MEKKKYISFFLAFLLLFLTFSSALADEVEKKMQVCFLDVQEGEASLLRTPGGKNILLDTGGLSDGNTIVNKLSKMGIEKIDLLIITHPHNKNLGGAMAILGKISVNQIIDNGIVYGTPIYKRYQELVQKKKLTVNSAQAGISFPIDKGVEVEFFTPQGNSMDDCSLVCRFTYGQISFLFAGDVSASYLPALTSNVLKVAQNSDALDDNSLDKIKAKDAIIFQTDKKVNILEKREILNKHKIITHLAGKGKEISIITDGINYQVERMEKLPSENKVIEGKKQIIINLSKHTLTLYRQGKVYKQYGIAVGKATTPTPVGNFTVVNKIEHPEKMKPALGIRWLGFYPHNEWPTYGIHGTNMPWSIGKSVSNGCIRMHNKDALDLYQLVEVGTPITIIK